MLFKEVDTIKNESWACYDSWQLILMVNTTRLVLWMDCIMTGVHLVQDLNYRPKEIFSILENFQTVN